MKELVEKTVICHHCGDDCMDNLIERDGKSFCCEGCNIVDDILESNDLREVYEENFQLKRKGRTKHEYDYLENEEVVKKLIHFSNETYYKISINLPAIHCSACILILENLPKFLPGVTRSNVNFNKKELTILYRHASISLKEIAEFLHDLGYKPDFNFSALESKKQKKDFYKNLSIKIAVAGFCFGNSMLISLPEYLDTNLHLEEKYKVLFGIVNLILILPVVFYSGLQYFTSAIRGLSKKQVNLDVPIALGITLLFFRTTYEIITMTGAGYADSLTGLIFFLLIGRWYQNKTYQALSFDRDYKSFFPISVTKLTADHEVTIPLSSVERGDHLLIRNGELVPVDCLLIKGTGSIDYSFVTGESLPETIKEGKEIFAGGKHGGPPIIVEAQKSVNNSYLTQLWQQKEDDNKEDPALALIINKISKHFTFIILAIAFTSATYWYFVDISKLWNSFSSVLIVACPCALALASPFAYGHAIRILGRKGIYLKDASVVEKLARIRNMIWDKTGTLTNTFNANVHFQGAQLNEEELALVRTVVHNSMHPLSRLIYQSLPSRSASYDLSEYEEIPGKGIKAKINNLPIKVGAAKWVGADDDQKQINETKVYISIDGDIKGYYAFKQYYRKGVFDLLNHLKGKYSLHLLSGDNEGERDTLSPYFTQLHFNQNPHDKRKYLESIKKGEDILMIGDGLNDAGALKEAHVGIALTDDIHQFSPACDIIYDAKELEHLDNYLSFARKTLRIVYAAFAISFLYNLVGLAFAVTGNLTPLLSAILMPVSSVTVVLFVSLSVMQSFNNALNPKKMIKVIPVAAAGHIKNMEVKTNL